MQAGRFLNASGCGWGVVGHINNAGCDMAHADDHALLYVEDDRFEQMAFDLMMKQKKLPYLVTIAGSVQEAREKLTEKTFDVIVTDFALGDGTGFDLFPLLRGAPIIVVTAAGDQEIAVRAMKAGAYDYLIKDESRHYLSILPLTLEKAIDWKRTERQLRLLSDALMHTSDSVIITDPQNRITFVNNAFLTSYGYAGPGPIGSDCSIIGETGAEGEFEHTRKDGSTIPVLLSRSVIRDERGDVVAIAILARDIAEKKRADLEREKLIRELQEALANVKALSGMLPICAWCKKVRDDKGYWNQVEQFIRDHSEAEFTHGICPDCAEKYKKEFDDVIKSKIHD